MSETRLALALADAAPLLPETGRIAVFGPAADADLSMLPADRVQVVQPFFPAHETWADRGYQTGPVAEGDSAAAVIFLPRAKALARAWICDASRVTGGGLIVVDGQKTDGIVPLLKAVRGRVDPVVVLSKAHGKTFWFSGGDFADWRAADRLLDGGWLTRPGVFSADGVDKGSTALIAALPARIAGRVADLGAGWGYLARDILSRTGVTVLDLIEADHTALECARRNVDDPRARFFWTDASAFTPDAPYDVVISNPPFHTGRAGDPDLGRAFIVAAAGMLKPAGQFWMVANRHLPYEATLAEHFRDVAETGGTPGFKVLHAAKPRRKRG